MQAYRLDLATLMVDLHTDPCNKPEARISAAFRVHAYVAELGAHNPEAVLEYVDREVPVANEAVAAEYLKALMNTNALSHYIAQVSLP